MTSAAPASAVVSGLHPDDVVRVLVEQHDQLRAVFSRLRATAGRARALVFTELAHLLALHESAEEQVLRPVTIEVGELDVARARRSEELRADTVLARLEDLEPGSDQFDMALGQLEAAVLDHIGMEEAEEFPAILTSVDEARRRDLGRTVRIAVTGRS